MKDWTLGKQSNTCPLCGAAYSQGAALCHVGNGAPDPTAGTRVEFSCGSQFDYVPERQKKGYRLNACFKVQRRCGKQPREITVARQRETIGFGGSLCGSTN